MSLRPFVIIVVALSPLCAHSQNSVPTSMKDVNTKALIDSIDKALYRTYIFPDKSKLMAQYLRNRFKKGAYKSISDPKALAELIESDIQAAHRDRHLRVHYDPDFAKNMLAEQPPTSTVIDTMELKRERSDNFGFRKVEILNGNIGYVQFNAFSGMMEPAKAVISAAFRFLSNSDAIIIDLRKNGGGSPWMVKHVSSYFVTERTRLNDIYDRRVDKTMEFWADPAEAGNMNLTMPMYILTSRHTFSAAEDFTYAMKTNKRAIIVGDTTGGGAHPTGPVYVGQDFVIDIPFARSINHITKTDWEGTGVYPDIAVDAADALLKAQEIVFKSKIADAKSESEKQVAQWYVNALYAHDQYDSTLTPDVLETYEGEYGRFKVYTKHNALYLDDFVGRTFRLKPIRQNLFLGDDWFQVEFLSQEGKVSQMKMSGKPGWVDLLERK